MDAFIPGAPRLPRYLGRNTTATIAAKKHWETLLPAAPQAFAGTSASVEVSPPIYRYCPGGWDNQVIGMCVGSGTRNCAATLLRIPEGCVFDGDRSTPALPTRPLSGLYCYWNARNVHGGVNFGEGAVVAYSLDAVRRWGVIPQSLWPDTEANQKAYSDRRPPTDAMRQEGAKHAIVHAARITSRDQFMDFLAQGYPIVDGVQISNGWTSTAADGKFSLSGRIIGGHCTVTVGYDRKLNRLYKRNSWAHWGRRTQDPEFQGAAGGYDNIGYCALDEFESRYLTPAKFSSGETDAFVINDVPGFDGPKIKFISAVELFT